MSEKYGAETVLVVVDVQNDFADPHGSLYVQGAPAVIEAVNREVAAALEAGSPVVYTQDWHPPITPHFEKDGGVWPVHCVAETWGAAFPAELDVSGEIVRKGTGGEDGYSGFTMRDPESDVTSSTGLRELLRRAGATHVVIVGLATDYCVKATALDALESGFTTSVVVDAVAPVDVELGDGERALAEMAAAGVSLDS